MRPMRMHARIAIDGRTVRIARQMRELHGASQRSATIRDECTHVAISRALTECVLNSRAFFCSDCQLRKHCESGLNQPRYQGERLSPKRQDAKEEQEDSTNRLLFLGALAPWREILLSTSPQLRTTL